MEVNKKVSPWLVTVSLMFLTWLVTYILSPFIAPSVFILFVSSVAAASYYGGYRQGLLATVLVGIINYFFPPMGDTIPNFLIRYASFIATTFVVSGLQTKRRTAETALQREVERSAAITSSVNEAIISINRDNKIVFANPSVEEMFGYELGEMIGQDLTIIMPVKYRAAHNEGFARYLKTNKKTFEWKKIAVSCVRKNGEEFPVDISFSEYILGTERLFTAVIRDMTEERKIEVLDRAQRMFSENVKDYAMFVLDENGNIVDWNNAADGVYGYTKSEVLGKSARILYYNEEDFEENWKKEKEIALSTGKWEDTQIRKRKDGSEFSALLVLTPLYDETNKLRGFLKLVRDITEFTEHQEMLAKKAQELEMANKSKDNFLAVLSHELRNPLVSILGYSNLLLSGRLGEVEQKKAIETIARNAKLQVEMIEDLLNISRIVSGKISLNKKVIPLCKVIHETVESFRPAATAKGITIKSDFRSPDTFTEVDERRIQQVVFNLMSNAVKFTDAGGTITVTVRCEDERAKVEITDTGIGIPNDRIPHIFDRFRQENPVDTRKHGGLGLGLSIVKTIVDLHGGKVEVESEVGKGSTFRLILDTCEGNPDEIPKFDEIEEIKKPERVRLDGLKILVVDDSDEARELLSDLFRMSGAEITSAENASTARERIKEGQFDVLVLDIGMPEENGYSLLKSLRQSGIDTPALALTAFVGAEYHQAALEAGFQDYLTKPPSIQYLLRRVLELSRK